MTDPVVGVVLEGRYRLEERLARGGMSTVYSATDLRLHRTVAVKVMADHLVHDPTFVDRFTREARAAAMLSHPNVVSVSDQGSDQGLVFLVMELVRGRTLRDLLHGARPADRRRGVRRPRAGAGRPHRRAPGRHRAPRHQARERADRRRRRGQGRRLRPRPRRRRHRSDQPDRRRAHRHRRLPLPRAARARPGRRPQRHLRGRHRALRDAHGRTRRTAATRRSRSPTSTCTTTSPRRRRRCRASRGRSTSWSPAPPAATPAGRPIDAGAFLAELARPAQGPRHRGRARADRPQHRRTRHAAARPTARRAARGTPATRGPRCSGPAPDRSHRPHEHAAGHGRRPDDERQRPQARVERTRPGVPQHIRRRRARLAVAIVLLLAITIGAIGWWLGSGRWTEIPDARRHRTAGRGIDLLQAAGLDPDCCEEQWSETVARGRRSSRPTRTAGEADPRHRRAARRLQGPRAVRRRPRTWSASRPEPWSSAAAGRRCRIQVTTDRAVRQRRRRRGWSIGFDPPAGTELKRDARSSPWSSASATRRSPSPTSIGQTPEQATANLEQLGFTVERVEDGRSADVDIGRGHGRQPRPGRRSGGLRQHGDHPGVGRRAGGRGARRDRARSADEATADARGGRAAGRASTGVLRQQGRRPERRRPARRVEQGTTVKILLNFW